MASNILYLRMKKAVKRLNRSLDEKKRLIRIYKRRTADLRRRLAKVSREKAEAILNQEPEEKPLPTGQLSLFDLFGLTMGG